MIISTRWKAEESVNTQLTDTTVTIPSLNQWQLYDLGEQCGDVGSEKCPTSRPLQNLLGQLDKGPEPC